MSNTLPLVDFCGLKFSKLLLGSNPFSGFSHNGTEMDDEMSDFYKASEIVKAFNEAKNCGINGFCGRGDRHMLRVIREYANAEPNPLYWIAQTVPEFNSFDTSIYLLTAFKPLKPTGIYHHGGMADNLINDGKKDVVKDNLKKIRDTGCLTGVASHQPEIIAMYEEEGWDVDFYLTCFCNLTGRGKKGITAVQGSIDEKFTQEDPPKMAEVVRKVKKPCVAFKIFGAGRWTKTYEDTYKSIKFAIDNIKPNDVILTGVYQKDKNQIKENADILRKIMNV